MAPISCSPIRRTAKSWKNDVDAIVSERGKKTGTDQRPAFDWLAHHFRRTTAVSDEHGAQDEEAQRVRQPDCLSTQRNYPCLRATPAGESEKTAAISSKTICWMHHCPAAEHLLQYRHSHLHLGLDQPQTRTQKGQSALINALNLYQPLRRNLGAEKLRTKSGTDRANYAIVPYIL